MQKLENEIQAFKNIHEGNSRPEEEFNQILLDWAARQPNSIAGFLDIAAGQGFEAAVLEAAGYKVIAIDPSEEMTASSVYEGPKAHSIDDIDPESKFSGVLLKDALLFLSDSQRIEIFIRLKQLLISGGSILIKSEGNDVNRARYIPKDSQYPQSLSSYDFKTISDWAANVLEIQLNGGNIFTIEYICTIKNLEEIAKKVGMSLKIVIEYDRDNALSVQSRWVNKRGFIVELKT